MELEDNQHCIFCLGFYSFLYFRISPASGTPTFLPLPWLFWNKQLQGFNEPGFMPVMILAVAPGERPPALTPVFPQLRATNNESVD